MQIFSPQIFKTMASNLIMSGATSYTDRLTGTEYFITTTTEKGLFISVHELPPNGTLLHRNDLKPYILIGQHPDTFTGSTCNLLSCDYRVTVARRLPGAPDTFGRSESTLTTIASAVPCALVEENDRITYSQDGNRSVYEVIFAFGKDADVKTGDVLTSGLDYYVVQSATPTVVGSRKVVAVMES